MKEFTAQINPFRGVSKDLSKDPNEIIPDENIIPVFGVEKQFMKLDTNKVPVVTTSGGSLATWPLQSVQYIIQVSMKSASYGYGKQLSPGPSQQVSPLKVIKYDL